MVFMMVYLEISDVFLGGSDGFLMVFCWFYRFKVSANTSQQ